MNWFKKFWLRLSYRHPGVKVKALSGEKRGQAITLYRKTLQDGGRQNKKKVQETLTLCQIAAGQESVFVNAKALIKEAKWLRLKRSYARAFALAKLAQEELGKLYLLDYAAMLAFVDADNNVWTPFWKSWRDHKAKSFFMKLPFAPNMGGPERIDAEENAKLSALYVEFEEGAFVSPAKAISRGMMNEMLDICDVSVIHARSKFRDTPLLNKDGSPGPRLEALLTTFWEFNELGEVGDSV